MFFELIHTKYQKYKKKNHKGFTKEFLVNGKGTLKFYIRILLRHKNAYNVLSVYILNNTSRIHAGSFLPFSVLTRISSL